MQAVGLQEKQDTPLNREPKPSDLVSSYLTPSISAYDRNHGPIPSSTTSTEDYILYIYPPIDDSSARERSEPTSSHDPAPTASKPEPHRLPLSQLRTRYEKHTLTSALQCAGNRRHSMRTRLAEVQGIDWKDGAILNAKWSGVLLWDVLQDTFGSKALERLLVQGSAARPEKGDALERLTPGQAELASREGEEGKSKGEQKLGGAGGVRERMQDESKVMWHCQFECNQQETQKDGWYGASIPLERCFRKEAELLLAWEMNDHPLTTKHGAPLRLVVPGICGARSVKWLDTIRISRQESANHYQQRDYKILPPDAVDAGSAEKYWAKVPPLMDMPVNSVVVAPGSGEEVSLNEDGHVEVLGYAVPAGVDGPVIGVQVSLDEGESWEDAELLDVEEESRWAWMRWRMLLDREILTRRGEKLGDEQAAKITILSRARDRGGNLQEGSEWNLRGVAFNGYGEARDVAVRL